MKNTADLNVRSLNVHINVSQLPPFTEAPEMYSLTGGSAPPWRSQQLEHSNNDRRLRSAKACIMRTRMEERGERRTRMDENEDGGWEGKSGMG